MRDFVYDEREIEKETREQLNLAEEKKRQFVSDFHERNISLSSF